MKCLVKEQLSEHKYRDNNGYLICVDSVLARTGKQTYLRSEIFNDAADDDTEIEVDRRPEEVFSDKTLASFENCPICVEHPNEDVNPENYREYAVGFVRDVHKGLDNGQEVILGTLVITDAKTIEEIENGEHTDLSCGYDCNIDDSEHPQQTNIRGNHVALCEQGRAGNARIVDTAEKINDYQTKEISNKRIEEVPTFGRNYIREKIDKKEAALLAIKSHLEDIIEAAEPEIRGDLRMKADKIIKDLKAQFDIKDSVKDVNPREGESKEDFISRFMSETKGEYPDEKQRLAVAYSYWEKRNMKDADFSYEDLKRMRIDNYKNVDIYKVNGKYCTNPNVSRERFYTIGEVKEYIDKRFGDSVKDSYKTYKGYNIEYNFYGKNEYTVQYQGDDIWFKSEKEAKDFIDEITSIKDAQTFKESDFPYKIKRDDTVFYFKNLHPYLDGLAEYSNGHGRIILNVKEANHLKLSDEETTAEEVTKDLEKDFEKFKENRMEDEFKKRFVVYISYFNMGLRTVGPYDFNSYNEAKRYVEEKIKTILKTKNSAGEYCEISVATISLKYGRKDYLLASFDADKNGRISEKIEYGMQHAKRENLIDSVKDSTFVVRYKDLYHNEAHEEDIKANSIGEAVEELKKRVVLRGIGTANVYVNRIENTDTKEYYPKAFGKLNSLTVDSVKFKDAAKTISNWIKTKNGTPVLSAILERPNGYTFYSAIVSEDKDFDSLDEAEKYAKQLGYTKDSLKKDSLINIVKVIKALKK